MLGRKLNICAEAAQSGRAIDRNHRIPVLLKLLEIQDCIVTIEALGMRKKIAKTVKKGRGRNDVCQCWATTDPEYLTS
jgi:predicted transposase YbfD/YdcC